MDKNEFCRCLLCGWGWVTRYVGIPRHCPKCRRVGWNSSVMPDPGQIRVPGQKGTNMKYPQIATLEVGAECFVSWMGADGEVDFKVQRSLSATIQRYGKRHGKLFTISARSRGLIVFRRS